MPDERPITIKGTPDHPMNESDERLNNNKKSGDTHMFLSVCIVANQAYELGIVVGGEGLEPSCLLGTTF